MALGLSLVALHGLFVVVASLVAKASALGAKASVAVAHRLRCPKACGIFPARDQTRVPSLGRWILNQWTTGEDPIKPVFKPHCFVGVYFPVSKMMLLNNTCLKE